MATITKHTFAALQVDAGPAAVQHTFEVNIGGEIATVIYTGSEIGATQQEIDNLQNAITAFMARAVLKIKSDSVIP